MISFEKSTVNSGTSTLHAALEACGVKEGDEVISPALTVIMDTTATIHANAIPVYVDIDPRTFTMDPNDLQNKITRLPKSEVESIRLQETSLMPAKLLNSLSDQQMRDLLAFLKSLR